MHTIDWLILLGFVIAISLVVLFLSKLNRSVADFMAANRCAGRYLLTIAQGVAGTGAISIVATFEMFYAVGFSPTFWNKIMAPVSLIITLTGWVIYRFRETRALTMAQFFEMRYSRRFRIFAGMLTYLSGVINYGIFPGVSSRFLVYFCDLPHRLDLVWFTLPTHVPIMAVILGIALFFTLSGGQIVIIITDFIQGQLMILIFIFIGVFLFFKVDWNDIIQTLQAPQHTQASLTIETAIAERQLEREGLTLSTDGESDTVEQLDHAVALARIKLLQTKRNVATEFPRALGPKSLEGDYAEVFAQEGNAGLNTSSTGIEALPEAAILRVADLPPEPQQALMEAQRNLDIAEARLQLAKAQQALEKGSTPKHQADLQEAETALAAAVAGTTEPEKLGNQGKSRVNPFDTSKVKDFNIWFYLIMAFGAFYTQMAWQGSQGYNASAKSPHEARMAGILGVWRAQTTGLLTLLMPICVFVIIHSFGFSSEANIAANTLAGIDNPSVIKQVTTTVVIREILPIGIMGLFAAIMFSAAISTDNTYLHSWGSILIQDVILPIRGKPFSPEIHMRLLRLSIIAVAVFAFIFSWAFDLAEYILMFFAVTGAIYLGGAGAAIIGGLYWKRGTTAGAYTAMICGAVIGVGGIIIRQLDPDFPINGQWMWFIAMVSSMTLYIVVSLITCRKPFDLDRMLHRGKYDLSHDHTDAGKKPTRGLKALGISKEFTTGDRILYFATMAYSLLFFFLVIGLVAWNYLVSPLSNTFWENYWFVIVVFTLVLGIAVTVWFVSGGIRDMISMVRHLKSVARDTSDDGTVPASEKQRDGNAPSSDKPGSG